jgi:chitinase
VLLEYIREAIGREKVLSIAVPGKEGDMMAFTEKTVPRICDTIDFLNVRRPYTRFV